MRRRVIGFCNRILLFSPFFLVILMSSSTEPACVVPPKPLPLSAYTFRPSTLQIFTALNLTCSGFVTGWRVVLTSLKPLGRVNGVYLAVFRQLTVSKFQLMGITEVNNHMITSSNNNDKNGAKNNNKTAEHVGWEVIPARPQFPVQRGDVLGIFYKRWFIAEREVSIPVAGEEFIPPGTPPTFVAMKDWYDVSETLQNGGVLSMSDAGVVRRLPALQAFVNVGSLSIVKKKKFVCGNSRVEDAEECDDSNTADNDGCSSLCRNEPISGLGTAGISAETWNVMNICGNNVLEPPAEECDDGNRINGDGCSSKCRLEDPGGPTCGNGKHEPGEQCDDGNNRDGDGCSADCRTEELAVCGNKILEVGEQCDDGNDVNNDGCSSRCMLEGLAVCGDYNLDATEECDDGNTKGGDGCSANCTKELCGNGIRDANEECDDGNNRDGDGCSAKCTSKKCGNGLLESNEQCDDGNNIGGDGCAANCILEICGNGIKEGAEQCDDGGVEPGDGCSPQCTLEICGNGVIDPKEECDDGNSKNGDGCSSSCKFEILTMASVNHDLHQKPIKVVKQVRILPPQEMTTEVMEMTTEPTTVAPTIKSPSTTTLPLSTLGIAPPAAPMVDFSNFAEGETFALGSAAAATPTDSGTTIGTPLLVPHLFRQRSALRNLEGQLRILPPRQSSRSRNYHFPTFGLMRKSTKRHHLPPATEIPPPMMALPGQLSQFQTFYEQSFISPPSSTTVEPIITTTTTTKSTTIRVDLSSPTVSPKCFEAPLLSGTCRSEPQVRWFFNSITNHCDWFYDKSCYAGANYFESKQDCLLACGLLVSDFSETSIKK